ncbi:hypothetical protein HOD05_04785 [Candidatus Woesearchaeota archaeon]|jgi:large subunit ribosomal protein L31e|nr:hypothetical protein [Candidatus Woesearchaeota archaeon]MBT4150360.1 hypothetical protein [Candidatus Woesearchaeota archaeon]MBT4434505.1 hypothetical protein [Candidatus Woesearchaeota archaeon]MBT7332420.1 hypothetical protein [Candidatus Woesearchaeota archaeon]
MAKATPKTIERVYNVPLRKEFRKVPRWKKTKKAVTALRQFLSKHMKSEDVKLSKKLNEHVWKHGIRNPPHHVKVTVSKDEKGVVNADLFGEEKVSKKSAPKAAKVEEKKAEVKEEAKPETKAESA